MVSTSDVGVNLVREGLDLPEVSLVAILDADKEDLLRAEWSLFKTIDRGVRHIEGMALFHSVNLKHGITLSPADKRFSN